MASFQSQNDDVTNTDLDNNFCMSGTDDDVTNTDLDNNSCSMPNESTPVIVSLMRQTQVTVHKQTNKFGTIIEILCSRQTNTEKCHSRMSPLFNDNQVRISTTFKTFCQNGRITLHPAKLVGYHLQAN